MAIHIYVPTGENLPFKQAQTYNILAETFGYRLPIDLDSGEATHAHWKNLSCCKHLLLKNYLCKCAWVLLPLQLAITEHDEWRVQ